MICIFLILLLLIIIFGCIFIFKKSHTRKNMPTLINGKYPIWQCWTGYNDIPPYLQLCHETVKKHNNQFSTILVTPNNLHQYIKKEYPIHPAYEYLSYVHKADYLRCYLLHHYGGMYLDMDTICFKPLDYVFKKLSEKDYEIVGYDGSKWGEVWGISVLGPNNPNTKYTNEWYNKLNSILDEKLEELKEFRKSNNDPKQDCIGWSEILRDIVLPISKKYNKKNYFIIKNDWQPIDDKQIIKPSKNFNNEFYYISELLILNNALYPDYIKNADFNTIKNNKDDILLFKLLNYSLNN